jgi:hypothetical protein
MTKRTEYTEDALEVQNGTQPEEIQAFVERRATNPVEVGDLLVWNFNNHKVNIEALESQADGFIYDEYVIPYQASGVWAYMTTLLPELIREAEILAYDQSRGQYNPYPNFFRHTDAEDNDVIKRAIEEQLEGRV